MLGLHVTLGGFPLKAWMRKKAIRQYYSFRTGANGPSCERLFLTSKNNLFADAHVETRRGRLFSFHDRFCQNMYSGQFFSFAWHSLMPVPGFALELKATLTRGGKVCSVFDHALLSMLLWSEVLLCGGFFKS